MKLTKTATRPIIVLELVTGYLGLAYLQYPIPSKLEELVIAVVGVYFLDRVRTHIWGDRDATNTK